MLIQGVTIPLTIMRLVSWTLRHCRRLCIKGCMRCIVIYLAVTCIILWRHLVIDHGASQSHLLTNTRDTQSHLVTEKGDPRELSYNMMTRKAEDSRIQENQLVDLQDQWYPGYHTDKHGKLSICLINICLNCNI